ncbi:synaptotagmin-like protein 2 isoform X2 [Betta splendens]|uniref:Synaptotagmin-like protein 2 n=1 Tax=Betta splendens TaxID=158456 RepID=A0A6P7PCF1_BETSP|nr:synaptotagmin-like protein 2 isoform X2 [Betta splendens]
MFLLIFSDQHCRNANKCQILCSCVFVRAFVSMPCAFVHNGVVKEPLVATGICTCFLCVSLIVLRKLETVLSSGSPSDSKLKYLTGEWFYEAKSRRHTDKIHGSDIILASMKQRKAAGLDGSLRLERPRIPSSRAAESVPPSKPARCLEATQPQQINDAEKENVHSGFRSPRMRHNPFNRASLIPVEPPESNMDTSPVWDQVSPNKELASPLKNPLRGELAQTSGGSLTSEGSSAGFRPVPKKRTFLPRRSHSETSDPGFDAQVRPEGVVPAPRTSLQRGSSGSSNQSRGRDEMPQRGAAAAYNKIPQPLSSAQDASNSHLEMNWKPPSPARDRGETFTENQSTQKAGDAQAQRECVGVKTVILPKDIFKDSGYENTGSVVREMESSTHSIVDPEPPVSYDLKFIDKTDQQAQYKSNPKHVFKLSTQVTSPTGDEDSIAKVLDWFSRSTDSSDWLKRQDDPGAAEISEKHAESNKIKYEESLRNDNGNIYRREEALEMERGQRQTNEALGVRDNKTQNEEMVADSRERRMQPQEVEDNDDDWQSPRICHQKSFWEKSNNGLKMLISKSVAPSDSEQKPAHQPAGKKEASVSKQHGVFNMPFGINSRNGSDQRIADNTDGLHLDVNMQHRPVVNTHDPTHDDLLNVQPKPQDRRSAEVSHASRPGPQSRTAVQSRGTPAQPNQQPVTSQVPEELTKTLSVPGLDVDVKPNDSPAPEKIGLSRNSLSMAFSLDENDGQVDAKRSICRQSSDVIMRMDREDEDPNMDQRASPQEGRAEKIKQLRSFWEQEMNKPTLYKDKPKVDGKVYHRANRARLNKRFTKSEYDLRSVGNDSDGDADDSNRNHPNFTVVPLNQRMESLSPSLNMSRSNFNTLRVFWDEAAAEARAPLSHDKPKSPKRKEPVSAHIQSPEFKWDESEVHSTVEKTRPAMKSSPPPQGRSRSPQSRSESRRSSKEFSKEKPTKSQMTSGRETRPAKGRKDSFSNSSGRSSLRRATSMFALCGPDEKGPLQVDVSPVQSQSRKERPIKDKGVLQRRSSEETETLTPLARAFVPRDYRHYLGMTDGTSVHASLAPAVREEGSEGRPHEFAPVRASTPVCSEERSSRKANRPSQRPLGANYSSSDTGQESAQSSTSDTRPSSRASSNRENDNETHNLVRKALKRAEARPRNLAKSMEDIASSSEWQERGQEPPADVRRTSDVSTIPLNSSSLFSDPDHLKKMSKSVPSFLQKEDADIDTDSTFEDHRGKLMMGRSMSNLTDSSGMASMSSLSGSVMTMYSGDFGNIDIQGNIQFSINYVQRLQEFHIFVAECRDLAAVDQKRARSDPYVKSYLVPDKDHLGKRKTSVKKKTLNPIFNEILRYRVRMDHLRTQTLILSVWHHDTFGRNSFLGEVDVDLSNWDLDHTQMNYLALKPRNILNLVPSNYRGEMRLAIRFLPQITRSEGLAKGTSNFGEIHIWVKDCKNLPLVRTTIDPYVKCFVLPDTSRKSRQKTRVLRRTANPVFNHTMVYDGIREVDLTEACVELTVWDRDRLAGNLLGGLRLGSGTGRSYGAAVDWMDSGSDEVALWERMMASPNEWIEGVLPLRTLNCAKTALK